MKRFRGVSSGIKERQRLSKGKEEKNQNQKVIDSSLELTSGDIEQTNGGCFI